MTSPLSLFVVCSVAPVLRTGKMAINHDNPMCRGPWSLTAHPSHSHRRKASGNRRSLEQFRPAHSFATRVAAVRRKVFASFTGREVWRTGGCRVTLDSGN